MPTHPTTITAMYQASRPLPSSRPAAIGPVMAPPWKAAELIAL